MRAISSCLRGCQAGVIPQQGLQELVGAGGGQRVEPQLRVVGLAAPAVLVLRAVVDQEQQAGRGQALDQAVEQGLRLGVDPVQVFEDQQQRLHLAFAQQHALEGRRACAGAAAVDRAAKRAVVRQGLQQRQQRRDGVLEGLVQRQHLPGDLGPDGAGVVAVLDVAVALEQVDDGEVGRGFAIGHRGALQHRQPCVWWCDGRTHRPGATCPPPPRPPAPPPGRARLRLRQRLVQWLQLGLPPDKARQPAPRRPASGGAVALAPVSSKTSTGSRAP